MFSALFNSHHFAPHRNFVSLTHCCYSSLRSFSRHFLPPQFSANDVIKKVAGQEEEDEEMIKFLQNAKEEYLRKKAREQEEKETEKRAAPTTVSEALGSKRHKPN